MIANVNMTTLNSSDSSLLTQEETLLLFNKYKLEQDEVSKEKIICSNMRLVLSIVQKFKSRGEDLNDLFQIGCIGLMKAVERFDLSRKLKFSTYAVWTIEGEIKRYLRDDSLIRTKRNSKNLLYKINKAKDELINENGFEPTNKQIAKRVGIEEREVINVFLSLQSISSLSEPIENDREKTLLVDKIVDNSSSEESILTHIALKEAFTKLGEKEKKVINMRFFLEKTQAEIAEEFGISQAQVSRMEKTAIKEMKKHLH
ncbi:RNA polymerase sigma-F factor [compost metagenome]